MLGWLDHRTGIKKLIALMLLEGVPGGAKWRYVWGSCLAFVFTIQLVTGLMLMTAYSPSSSQAWASVHFIQYQMDFGWLIRGLHHFGSQTMVVLIALHMLQVVIAGAQLPPREVNWWLGIGLLSVTLGLSLTGYLLPWDQKGYWATDVATNIAGSLPEIGAEVKRQAVGGPDSGNHTLTRFYALHVGILPLTLVILLVAHIVIFRRHGVTSKQNPEGLVTKPENEHGAEPFWPRQAFYDMFACMIVFGLMLSAVLYGFAHPVTDPGAGDAEPGWYERIARWGMEGKGAELDAAADRDTAGYPARPEWYFLFLFQLLKYFPGDNAIWGTVIIPNGVMVLLFLLPLFGICRLRAFGYCVGLLVMVILLLGVGFLTLKALDDDKPGGILGGALKGIDAPIREEDSLKKETLLAESFQHKLHNAHILAARACQMAMDGAPVDGGHFLLRNDPLTKGRELFEQKCGSCHNFTHQDWDKKKGSDEYLFESMTGGKSASDLGDFGRKQWVLRVLKNSLDDKVFGLVKQPVKDEKGNVQKDKQGNIVMMHMLDGMKGWRDELEMQREDEKWGKEKIAAQQKQFEQIAEWLEDQAKPREKRSDTFAPGQTAFFNKEINRCSGCHQVEVKEIQDGKPAFITKGGKSAPSLANYGSAAWIRAMIMSPGHRSRYGKANLMPAFRNMDGAGSEISLQEFRDGNKDTPDNMIQPLSDVEREMIIRWILRDYRAVYGGQPIP